MTDKAKIFILYAREDKKYFTKLSKCLAPLKRDNRIDIFSAQSLQPGDNRCENLREWLNKADIIVLLLTANFFNLDCIMKKYSLALDRYKKGEAWIVPVYTKPCFLTEEINRLNEVNRLEKLNNFEIFPSSEKPVANSDIHAEEKAWKEVVVQIKKKISLVLARRNAREAGSPLLSWAELHKNLLEKIPSASNIWLCSRSGTGWLDYEEDIWRSIEKNLNSTKQIKNMRFLFMNPDSHSFKVDSLLQWNPGEPNSQSNKSTRTPQDRKERAIELYNRLIDQGCDVQVIDILVPAVFWAIDAKDPCLSTVVYLEIPKWPADYRGNLYLAAYRNFHYNNDSYLNIYRDIFEIFCNNAKPWINSATT